MALVRAVTGNPDAALSEIERSEERVLPNTPMFSCWTYTYRGEGDFRSDLREMRDRIETGAGLKPPFLDVAVG